MTNAQVGEIRLSAPQLQHPELLAGLEIWLQMGLLSLDQVQQFCRQNLVCEWVAPWVAQPLTVSLNPSLRQPSLRQPSLRQPSQLNDFADAASAPAALASAATQPAAQSTAQPPSWIARMLQAFMAEIGVIWLLCLGVFMVVVSSAVLAASQWQNVSPVGQYLILFSYTLAFWGASLWAARRPALRLTGRMLQIATLLIVPLNFWMMDGLQLWQQGAGVVVNLTAALALSGVTRSLLPRLETHSRLPLINALGLSWLHWGWSIAGMPLVTAYLGAIGTAVLTEQQARQQRSRNLENLENLGDSAGSGDAPEVPQAASALIVGLSTLLLIGRAVLAAQVPVQQLGLAFGICGWLFCGLTRPSRPERQLSGLWSLGAGLLILGWGVSVAAEPPWQAVAVSGLGLWLLGNRLVSRNGLVSRNRLVSPNGPLEEPPLSISAVMFLLLGLQTYGLLWRLLPQSLRQLLLDLAFQLFGSAGMPLALLGLAGFPYLWLMLGLARWQQNSQLAKTTEAMALGLGSLLIALGLWNPLLRSLVCALAAGTLIWRLRGRSVNARWMELYLCHLLILTAGFSAVEAAIPNLTALLAAQILLVGMSIEWSLSLGRGRWRQSCWYFGLAMAGSSYMLWLGLSLGSDANALLWLATPALLTGLSRRQWPQARRAAWLSAFSLIAQLALLNSLNSWMIACGAAVGLMLVNMLRLRARAAALLTVGFGLGLIATALDYAIADPLGFDWVMLLLAASPWVLWLLHDGLQLGQGELRQLYAGAAHSWAVGLSGLSLLSLSFYSLIWALIWVSADQLAPGVLLPLSGGLLFSAIAYQIWRQGGSEVGLCGLGWAAELVLILLVIWQNGSIETLALLTLGLGLVTQLAGRFWPSQTGQRTCRWMPLAYAGFGLGLAHMPLADAGLTATTGLYTLAAAVIGLGAGRRASKVLTVTALLLASVAAYELLIYQLMQASGGETGDGITLLAGLAVLIAVTLRLVQGWVCAETQLAASELAQVRHLHWGLGSALIPLAMAADLSSGGFWLWLLVGTVLSAYALLQGRQPAPLPPQSAGLCRWIYCGSWQAVGLVSAALYRWLPTNWLMAWAASLMAVAAVVLYCLPWRSYGWHPRPWCNTALLLPAVVVMLTSSQIALQSLLIVAAFYGWLAKAERQARLSYLGLLLLDWALLRYLNQQGWLNLTWTSAVLAGSLLYAAQVDPMLQGARQQRHWLRSFAVGMLSLTLLYQAELEVGTTALLVSLLTLAGAMGLIGLGLGLRTRAFLYVGTATFVIRTLRLLWLFIDSYALLLWAVGIVIGLALIWIAATFEARRSQVGQLLQYWLSEFDRWD